MNEIEMLKKFKKQKNISIDEISRNLGVSWITVHRWLTGKFRPHRFMKERIFSYLSWGSDERNNR